MSEAILKRMDNKLSSLLNKEQKQKETWVKASVITQLTGWSKEGMRRARQNGYVRQRKDDKGIWYLLESVNPIFHKK